MPQLRPVKVLRPRKSRTLKERLGKWDIGQGLHPQRFPWDPCAISFGHVRESGRGGDSPPLLLLLRRAFAGGGSPPGSKPCCCCGVRMGDLPPGSRPAPAASDGGGICPWQKPLLLLRGAKIQLLLRRGRAPPPQDFDRSDNPISTRGVNHTPQLTSQTPRFSDLPPSLICTWHYKFVSRYIERDVP